MFVLKHSFFRCSTGERGPFCLSRNSLSIHCIGFRFCLLQFISKTLFHLLFLLSPKAFFKLGLPCDNPIASTCITHSLLCLSPLFHISTQLKPVSAGWPLYLPPLKLMLLLLWLSVTVQYNGFFLVLLLFVPSITTVNHYFFKYWPWLQ